MEAVGERIKELCWIAYHEWNDETKDTRLPRRKYTIIPHHEAVEVIEQASGRTVASICD